MESGACIGQGYDEFYTGAIAKDVTNYFGSQEGGLLTMEVGATKHACSHVSITLLSKFALSILNKHPEIRTKRPWESRRLSWAELAACHVQDLANYSPGWAEPIHVTYRGYDIYSNPSTTRGGLEVLMGLNLLEGWDISSYGDPNHPMVLHLQVGDLQSSCTTSAVCPYDSTVYCHVPSHTGMHMLLV